MNYNNYTNESNDFVYSDSENYANKENGHNPDGDKKKSKVGIIVLLILLLLSIGGVIYSLISNKQLSNDNLMLAKDKEILLTRIDSLQNELSNIFKKYNMYQDSSRKEFNILNKRISYYKQLIKLADCSSYKNKLNKANQELMLYQQKVDSMQSSIDSLKAIIQNLEAEKNKGAMNNEECEARVKHVIDSMLSISPKATTTVVTDTLLRTNPANVAPGFTISNFKFTGIYHNKKQPDVDLETPLTWKMQEYMASFDIEADRIVAPRFVPTIYLTVISTDNERVMSQTEDQPDVFTLNGQPIEYTATDVPDFGDKIRTTMRLQWPVLKSNRPTNAKTSNFKIIIYTDKAQIADFTASLQYGKAPVFW